jgi:hypothetical protein
MKNILNIKKTKKHSKYEYFHLLSQNDFYNLQCYLKHEIFVISLYHTRGTIVEVQFKNVNENKDGIKTFLNLI